MTSDPKIFYNDLMPGKLGDDYEAARWHSSALQEAQFFMMNDVMQRHVLPRMRTAARILEVGPGAGTWSRVLMSALPQAHLVLLDISSEMLSRARKALGSRGQVEYIEHDFVSFSSDSPFDVVFSSRALEYMPDKLAVARGIAKLLIPGGYGFCITKMPKPFFDRLVGRKLSSFHQGQISPHALIALFSNAGLQVVAVRMATASVPLIRSALVNTLLFRIMRSVPLVFPLSLFAESYLIIVRKP